RQESQLAPRGGKSQWLRTVDCGWWTSLVSRAELHAVVFQVQAHGVIRIVFRQDQELGAQGGELLIGEDLSELRAIADVKDVRGARIDAGRGVQAGVLDVGNLGAEGEAGLE